MTDPQLLKKDLFGEIRRMSVDGESVIVRDISPVSPWVSWLARHMLQREARVLAVLDGFEGVPQLLRLERDCLWRSFLPGEPMQLARPRDPDYFKAAYRLLRTLHRAGVVHNDLAKEPNLLVQQNNRPAILDFQLAWFTPRRSRLFRLLAYEDLRHLLKHKRSYCPQNLTQRQCKILQNPTLPSLAYMRTIKPIYMFVTRHLLGWSDREGAADHGNRH